MVFFMAMKQLKKHFTKITHHEGHISLYGGTSPFPLIPS